jgi:hypothetical protein
MAGLSKPIPIPVRSGHFGDERLRRDVLPAVNKAGRSVSSIEYALSVLRGDLIADCGHRVLHRDRQDAVTGDDLGDIRLHGVEYEGWTVSVGMLKKPGIHRSVEQVVRDNVKRLVKRVNCDLSLPEIGCVGSQSDQIAGVVEMVMREQQVAYLRLFRQGKRGGDRTGVYNEAFVDEERRKARSR